MPDTIAIPEHNHALLENSFFGVLTTIRAKDGLLSSNPVGFVWDGQQIRISTLKSRLKYQNLAADDRVAFCVVSKTNVMDYVEIRGHASLEDDKDRSFFRTPIHGWIGRRGTAGKSRRARCRARYHYYPPTAGLQSQTLWGPLRLKPSELRGQKGISQYGRAVQAMH